MYIIGENIHIISEKVKLALKERDAKFFQELAVQQVEGGAQALDINLGPRKKEWEEEKSRSPLPMELEPYPLIPRRIAFNLTPSAVRVFVNSEMAHMDSL